MRSESILLLKDQVYSLNWKIQRSVEFRMVMC